MSNENPFDFLPQNERIGLTNLIINSSMVVKPISGDTLILIDTISRVLNRHYEIVESNYNSLIIDIIKEKEPKGENDTDLAGSAT